MATITGTAGDDLGENSLEGTPQADTYLGQAGEDWLISSAGNDTLDGGAGGRDRAVYWGDPSGITADFGAGTVIDGFGDTDTLVNIEWINGSGFADTLDGGDVAPSGEPYWLFGQGGDDVITALDPERFADLSGGEGNDTLTNGDGSSFLQPGSGTDEVTAGGNFDDLVYYYDSQFLEPTEGSGIDAVFTAELDGTVTDFAGDTDTFTGVERVVGTKFADSFEGSDGRQEFVGLQGNDTFDGGAGDNDWVHYDFAAGLIDGTGAVTVDLQAGTATDPFGDTDTLIDIERVRGTDLNDTLIGDAAENRLEGRGGNDNLFGGDGADRLRGGWGDDTIDGGGGQDRVLYGGDPGAISVDLGAQTATDGYGGTDTLIDVEWISATPFDDTLTGGDTGPGASLSLFGRDGNDVITATDPSRFVALNGGNGDDILTNGAGQSFLQPGAGDDTIDGGGAFGDFDDLVYYYSSAFLPDDSGSGIRATWSDIKAGTVRDFAGDTDTFANIERMIGTKFADTFTGSTGRQEFVGLQGNDTFDGGAGGDDFVGYEFAGTIGASTGSVSVNLASGTATDPFGDTDTLRNIEHIRGTDGDDVIIGNAAANRFEGRAGDDTLDGGAGQDVAAWDAARQNVTITISANGLTVEDRREGGLGTDEVSDIEVFSFADQDWQAEQFTDVANLGEGAFSDFVELYIAYFNRAPDAEGLFFWGTAFANGFSLEASAREFLKQPEYNATYPEGLSNEDFAREVYDNVLGRIPDAAGFDFWVGLLDGGAVGRDTFILEVLKGAKADPQPGASQEFIDQQQEDQAYLANKTDIGTYFAVTKGMSDVGDATAAMDEFDGSQASVLDAVDFIDQSYQGALDAENGEFLLPLVGVVDDPFAGV